MNEQMNVQILYKHQKNVSTVTKNVCQLEYIY